MIKATTIIHLKYLSGSIIFLFSNDLPVSPCKKKKTNKFYYFKRKNSHPYQ